ncbi:NIPSNAP family protein [Acidocella sp.]|uniref:NIPSNAP family protein n=1 Tax=Acidocella sp. TaxID=50710 RepID=UPI003D01F966
MIFELRSYRLKTAKALEYLRLFQSMGVEQVTAHLPLGGYFLTEAGMLNQIHHLWIYKNLAERDAARQNLASDSGWNQEFIPAAFPLIEQQANAFMRLHQGSPSLEEVCASRRRPHRAQSPGTMLFAQHLLTLTHSTAPFQVDGLLGQWQIANGLGAGKFVTLAKATQELPPVPVGIHLLGHELIRPLSLSPLQ